MKQLPTPTPPPLLNEDESDLEENHRVAANGSPRDDSHASEVPKTPQRLLSRSVTTTPKSHSRRATPRSNTRNSTPGRGSVRRTPSTLYTLRAMQQVAATPVREMLRETRRYTPTNDLRQLSRLLVKERDDQVRRASNIGSNLEIETTEDIREREQREPLNDTYTSHYETGTSENFELAPPVRIDSTQNDSHEITGSRLSESHHTTTISEVDENQRRGSGRLSGRFSLPSNNVPSDLFTDLAAPEALVDGGAHFGYDSGDLGGLWDNGGAGISSDDDDLDNDLRMYSDDELELSLLKEREESLPAFKPMRRSTTLAPSSSSSALKIPISLLRFISRSALKSAVPKYHSRDFKQKQFSKSMLSHLQQISDEFLTQQMQDLSLYAKHSNRKMINSDDVSLLIKRSKQSDQEEFQFVDKLSRPSDGEDIQSAHTQLFCLAEEFCNLSELREIEDNLYKSEVQRSRRSKKRKV